VVIGQLANRSFSGVLPLRLIRFGTAALWRGASSGIPQRRDARITFAGERKFVRRAQAGEGSRRADLRAVCPRRTVHRTWWFRRLRVQRRRFVRWLLEPIPIPLETRMWPKWWRKRHRNCDRRE
jgi:hypothetical protein